MILDRLSESDRYAALHPAFAAAFAFLRRPELAELTTGQRPLDGDRLFAIVERIEGRGRERARLEAHRKYIDIQYAVAGAEEMGWKPLEDCAVVDEPYDDARDIEFFHDSPEKWIAVPPGSFVIFFPADAHAPLGGAGSLHKVIIKVAVA